MKKNFILALSLLLLTGPASAADWRDTNVDAYYCNSITSPPSGQSTCVLNNTSSSGTTDGACSVDTSTNSISSSYVGGRLDAGTQSAAAVDRFQRCRYFVNNDTSNGIFVPFRTETEWTAFIAKSPTTVSGLLCACPYSGGRNSSMRLFYGPAGALAGTDRVGGSGGSTVTDSDLYKDAPSLPYGYEGQQKTFDNATFSFSCPGKTTESYTCEYCTSHTCGQGCWDDELGHHCASYDGCCSATKELKRCVTKWYDWSETFNFVATANNNKEYNPSWSGTSTKQNGSRPSQCYSSCTETTDSDGCTNVAAATACSIPDQLMYDSYTMFFCSASPSYMNYCMIMGFGAYTYESQIATAIANGDCDTASALRNEENTAVAKINAYAKAWYAQYTGTSN